MGKVKSEATHNDFPLIKRPLSGLCILRVGLNYYSIDRDYIAIRQDLTMHVMVYILCLLGNADKKLWFIYRSQYGVWSLYVVIYH